jgi:hypothetical protein
MLPVHAKVYSSDKKEMGSVSNVRDDYFVAMKKGIVMDEEYHIPKQAVEGVVPEKEEWVVEVGLSEEQLRHGYEIVEGKTGSDLVKGRTESELKLPTGKQLIRYSAVEYFRDARLTSAEGSLPAGYACDMCNAKFDNSGSLEKHRSKAHKGPVGL